MHIKNYNKFLILFLVIIIVIITSFLLPIFDNVNGFYNIFLNDYNLTWYDGRSPLNFYLIKNIIENGSASFPKGYLIGNMLAENYFDLSYVNGRYLPTYSISTDYIFAGILYFFHFSTNIQLFQAMIFLVIIFSSVLLIVFYFIQIRLGLKPEYAGVSTLMAGIATSILIYTRYLFIKEIFISLIFLILVFITLKNKFTRSIKNDIKLFLIVLIIFIIQDSAEIAIIFFLFFSYFFIKYKFIKHTKIYLIIFSIIIIFIFFNSIYDSYSTKFFKSSCPIFIRALDYITYGCHDPSSAWKLDRYFSYVYNFEEKPGNAFFMRFYSLFGSLFSPKGFIYNSPFLIFSIFGILIYKEIKKKNILLASIVLTIFIYGFLNPIWYGGVTPRYVRQFNIPVLFLTFFSFYYIQEVSREKNKFKKYLVYIIFTILVILSILNVSSLAIRADWTYEHDANLVSYDLVLWPWYPPTPTGNIINLYLTELGQSVEWKFGGEINGCKAYGTLDGIITPLCSCEYATYAERNIEIPWEKVRINVTACSKNGDGVIGKFYFDDKENDLFVEPNSCKEESILIENSSGNHSLILKPKKYGECTDEIVTWKMISIEKI